MSDLRINNITDRTGDSGPVFAGISTVSSTGAFVVPSGPTEYRGGRGRGVFSGGTSPDTLQGVNSMSYIEIATTGNASDFGDISSLRSQSANGGSSTRGVIAGGYGPAAPSPGTGLTQIDYMTFSSQGGASTFGDLSLRRHAAVPLNDSTRMLNVAGNTNPNTSAGDFTNQIDYITMASDGNAVLFGDLVAQAAGSYMAGTSTQTRMIFAGNISPAGATHIQYVEIASTGEAMDFGECRNGTNNFSVMMYSDSHGGLGGF